MFLWPLDTILPTNSNLKRFEISYSVTPNETFWRCHAFPIFFHSDKIENRLNHRSIHHVKFINYAKFHNNPLQTHKVPNFHKEIGMPRSNAQCCLEAS